MDLAPAWHSWRVMHRALVALAVSAGLVACMGKTTSLGEPSGDAPDAGAATHDGGGRDDAESPPEVDAAVHHDTVCHGYTWLPLASVDVACQYYLPDGPPHDSGMDPRLDPRTWDPSHVSVDTFFTSVDAGADAGVDTSESLRGFYVHDKEQCGTQPGWYYVDPVPGVTPTFYALCPRDCAAVMAGAETRLTAITFCEDR